MITGVLAWFVDADKNTTLVQKLSNAARVYRVKNGRRATVVYMHPDTAGSVTEAAGMLVRPNATVQRNHFYLGEQN